MAGLALVVAPAAEPITLAQARAYLKNEDVTADDALVNDLISSARELAEKKQDRAWVTQTWDQFLDAFPGADGTPPPTRFPGPTWFGHPIELRRPPLQSVTHLKYTREDGTVVTVDPLTYYVDLSDKVRGGALIWPKQGTYWPQDVLRAANGVEIRFVAGYGLAAAVPKQQQLLLKQIVAYWYYNRDAIGTLPAALEQQLLEGYARQYA